jgi:Cu(I)/Ag(I) efflux system membrane fusion protein
VIQTLGVRTAPAERGTLWKYIKTVGRIDYDETRLAHVHPRADGWIETLELRAEGEPVSERPAPGGALCAGHPVGPGGLSCWRKTNGRAAARVSADKARNILRLLDVPDDIIREIERAGEPRNRIPVRAPIDGIVTR